MITILCLRASPGLRIFLLYPLSLLSNMVIWPGSYQDCQIKRDTVSGVSFYLAASYPPRFTTDLAVFLMGNPKDFLSIMTYSPRKQYFVSAPSISAFVSLTSVLAWEQRQRLVVAGYHSTGSKSEWISYKW